MRVGSKKVNQKETRTQTPKEVEGLQRAVEVERWGGTDGDLRREHSSRCATLKANPKFLVCLGKTRGHTT